MLSQGGAWNSGHRVDNELWSAAMPGCVVGIVAGESAEAAPVWASGKCCSKRLCNNDVIAGGGIYAITPVWD